MHGTSSPLIAKRIRFYFSKVFRWDNAFDYHILMIYKEYFLEIQRMKKKY